MKRFLSLLVLLFVFVAVFAGCSKDATTPSAEPSASQAPSQSQAPAGETEEPAQVKYPLVDTPTTLTCYWYLEAKDITDLAEHQYWQKAAEKTNVHIKFTHPAGQEAFGLMVSSQDYPDMVKAFYTNYGQGIDSAIDDEIVQPLEDYTEYMPNYMALINGNDQIKLNTYSDNGHLWGIVQIVDKPQDPWAGPAVRRDLLDKAGYTKTPVTIADWEEMLTVFKDNYDSMKNGPLQITPHGASTFQGTITGAYGLHQMGQFLCIDKKVTHPILQPGFKDYIAKLNDWWNKGLIYNDYISQRFIYGPYELVLNNELGAFETIYNWFDSQYKAKSEDPDFLLVGVPLPKLNPNDTLHVRNTNGWVRQDNSLCIMANCSNIPLACQFWDFAFSEEGIILGNWGVEGVSFEYDAQGNPRYTDLVTKDPTDVQSGMTKWVLFNAPGFCIPTREQQGLSETSIEATQIWVNSAKDDWVYPAGAVMTQEEGAEHSAIWNDINTYISEHLNMFVMGQKPLSDLDGFIDQIKKLGIERCIEIRQQSVDRYYNRLNIVK